MSNGDVKVYVLTFGVAGVNLAALNQYLFDSSDIIAFWNYVPLVYCVKSRASATELTAKLKPFFPNGTYFLAEINSYNIDGLLPKVAWEWFYLNHHEKFRAPLPPLSGLGSNLLGPYGSGLGGVLGLLNPPDKG